MTINVNNQEQTIPGNSSIASLLEQLSIAKDGIAIAINNEVVTKKEWSQTLIKVGDNVTIIQATQGG